MSIETEAQKLIDDGKLLEYGVELLNQKHSGDLVIKNLGLISSIQHLINNIKFALYLNIVGDSGLGKSHCLDETQTLLTPNWINKSSITPKTLYRATDKNEIYHSHIIYIDDINLLNKEDLIETIKKITSKYNESTTHQTIAPNGDSIDYTIRGKYGFWFTSVESIPDFQLANRFININVEESYKHKNEVSNKIQDNERPKKVDNIDDKIEIFRYAIGLLSQKTYEVDWNFNMDLRKLDNRTQGVFYTVLKCIAFFNQKKRIIKDDVIYATKEDFYTARSILSPLYKSNSSKLSDKEQLILNCIINCKQSSGINIKGIQKETKITQRNLYRYLPNLLEKIAYLNEEKYGQSNYYTIIGDYKKFNINDDIIIDNDDYWIEPRMTNDDILDEYERFH